MLIEIVRHTPYWVWIALAVMLWRGYVLTRPQAVSLARAALLPAVFVLLSIGGVVSSFGVRFDTLMCWGAGLVLSAYEMQRRGVPEGLRYLPERRSFAQPGSWMPLLLIVLAFALRYTVAVQLVLHDWLHRSDWFAIGTSGVSGSLSGLFLGRTLRLWQAWRRAGRRILLPALS